MGLWASSVPFLGLSFSLLKIKGLGWLVLKFLFALTLLWVSGFSEGPAECCLAAFQLFCTCFAPLRPGKQWAFVLGCRSSLATALGAVWNYSHLTDREIEAQKGDLACPRTHSFKWGQVLEVGCPDFVSDVPCTVSAVRGALVAASFLAFGELEGDHAFPYSSASWRCPLSGTLRFMSHVLSSSWKLQKMVPDSKAR